MPQLLTSSIGGVPVAWDISANNLDVSYNLNINYPTGANGYVARGIVQVSAGGTNNNAYIVDSASGSYTFTQTPTSLYTATFTAAANRLYKMSVFGYANTTNFSGSIYIQVLIGGVLYYYPLYLTNPSTQTYIQFGGNFLFTTSSGSTTMAIQAASTASTSSYIYRTNGYPLYYSIEDIGQWNTGNAVLQDIVLSGAIASNYTKYYTNTINAQVGSPIIGGYTVYVFSSASNSTTLTGTITPNFTGEMDYLVVAGGGGGGSNPTPGYNGDGGGGAGGFRTSWAYGGVPSFPTGGPQREAPLYVTASSISVQVGAGGAAGASTPSAAVGSPGTNSTLGNVTCVGGGGGGSFENSAPFVFSAINNLMGVGGGSGGGSKPNTQAYTISGGTGITGQGFAGGAAQVSATSGLSGSGGGGAGGVGQSVGGGTTGGNGGSALASNITGSTQYYAGGGGGGGGGTAPSTGGTGGTNAGNGGSFTPSPSTAAVAGFGGGGGGGGGSSVTTGSIGGSGCVIVRFYSYVSPVASMQTLSFVNITPTFIVYVDATNNIQPIPQSNGYTIYGLTQTGTAGAYAVPNFNGNVNYLVVGGGGSGGNVNGDVVGAGGGGAGGLRTSFQYGGLPSTSGGGGAIESALSVTSGTQYSISVGAGAASGAISGPGGGAGVQGSPSTFATITSLGGGAGGGGGGSPVSAGSGGSGGGIGAYGTGNNGAGTPGQGYAGGKTTSTSYSGGGGGGGAGALGVSPNSGNSGGNGGNGLSSSITGTFVYYAGGGGGGAYPVPSTSSAVNSNGGYGGGGGGGGGACVGGNGSSGTGGGGGGAASCTGCSVSYQGGTGGSGIIILRIATYSGY